MVVSSEMFNKRVNYLKASFSLVLLIYSIVLVRDVAINRFLDRVDLIPHEAGHMLFSWFGEFLQVLGGTIGQLFVPVAFTVYFYMRKELFSSSVTLFWIGQNLFNVSVYIRDAQAMELPLVSIGGGEDTIHDWNYILTKFGVLRWDQEIGSTVYGVGLLIIIVSVILCGYFSFEKDKEGEGCLADSKAKV